MYSVFDLCAPTGWAGGATFSAERERKLSSDAMVTAIVATAAHIFIHVHSKLFSAEQIPII